MPKQTPKRQKPDGPARKRRLIRRVILAVAIPVTAAVCLFAGYRNWARKPTPPPPVRPSHQVQSSGAPVDSDRKEGLYTFLVVGFDKVGANTDTIMVVGCDAKNGVTSVMNIPRDTMVNAPWDIKRINSVYGMQGIEGLREHVGKLIGFLPDYYVTIDLEAFGKLVDAIDGVTFDVPINMYYDDPTQNLHIRQSKGERKLTGEDAMQVARFRINNDNTGYVMGDIDRIATQQALLTAIAKQCLQVGNLAKLPAFVEIFNENVESDLATGSMVWFGEQLLKLDTETDLHFFTMPGNYSASAYSRTYKSMQSYVTPKEEELIELVNLHLNPYKEPVEAEDLDLMRVDTNGVVSASSGELADTRANESRPKTAAPAASSPVPSPSAPPEPGLENEPSVEAEPEWEDESKFEDEPEGKAEPQKAAETVPAPSPTPPPSIPSGEPPAESEKNSGETTGLLPATPKPAGR